MMFLHKAKNNRAQLNCIHLLACFFLIAFNLKAQTDTLSLRYAGAAYPYFRSLSETRNSDTTLDNFHNSFPTNSLGNLGLPSYNFLQSFNEDKLGLRFYQLPFQNDLFKTSDPVYYFASPLYTSVYGSAGQVKEQALKLIHSQLINKKANITLKFNRYSGTGFYSKQLSYVNNLLLSSHYATNNKRWGYFTRFIYNKLKYQENGGLVADSSIQKDIFINKQLLDVNLQTARHNIRTSDVSFTHFFRLNKSTDSSRSFNHYIYHTAGYESSFYQYIEPTVNRDFYQHFYFDSLKTNDSTHLTKFINEARYVLKSKNESTSLYAGYKHEFTILHSEKWNPWFNNSIALAGGHWQNKSESFALNTEGEYIVNGLNKGDYRADLGSTINFKFKHSQILSRIIAESRSPDLLYKYYESNNFYWANNFNKTQSMQAEIKLKLRDWKLFAEANIKNLSNAIYFNNNALPTQYTKGVNVVRFTLGKDLCILKTLHFDNTLNYQIISDTTFIKLPSLLSSHQLYYQGNLYKNMLQLQVGFQCMYFSSFTGNAYMPATNVFYTQSTQQLGNYPFVDFFINAQIKPVRFFIKVAHINQGFSGYNYSLVPGYYQTDRAIKFGLNWLFWD